MRDEDRREKRAEGLGGRGRDGRGVTAKENLGVDDEREERKQGGKLLRDCEERGGEFGGEREGRFEELRMLLWN